jgi:Prenyltransferase and squalene oxidase repeat
MEIAMTDEIKRRIGCCSSKRNAELSLCAVLCFCGLLLAPRLSLAQATANVDVAKSGYGLSEWPQALRMADFILSLQNASGAIPDERGVNTVNEDSNMEYALIGLGAAYAASRNVKYLNGLEKGIKWLAEREEMKDPKWKGSWYYVYSADPPHGHIPTSPGTGITDVRGVDATSALFVYLVYLDQRLTGNSALARTYAANCRAALDFVLNRSLDSDGFSRSSWQLHGADGQWHFFEEKYSADQGDVYLGMRGGELLYHDARYGRVAETLRKQTPIQAFSAPLQRYALAVPEDGKLDTGDDGNSAAFSQGYLSWMWGDTSSNRAALEWLRSKVQPDGSIVSVPGKPAFSLNVAMLAMASRALAQPAPRKSLQWLIGNTYDGDTGGIRHGVGADRNREYNNETAFCLLGFLGFLPFE